MHLERHMIFDRCVLWKDPISLSTNDQRSLQATCCCAGQRLTAFEWIAGTRWPQLSKVVGHVVSKNSTHAQNTMPLPLGITTPPHHRGCI